ncbi:hypothetical protein [Jiangella anatolica]|uniref:Uncharacterized protein n=1 Tax=Jiangella anatolica TaxID=2670374 RepID=A0A2W2BZ01_9ACTN|nr:hypothetical protein [Jiangella anatolica]PZF81289.1 hypothetical protein C1I92_21750 [Jiangella anatolica]
MSGDEAADQADAEPVRIPSAPPSQPLSPRRRTGVVAAVGAALAGLAEGFLRDAMIIGTATLALVVAVAGLLAGSAGQAITGLLAGVGGAIVLVAGVARQRPVGRQWLAIAVVLAVNVALIVAWTA